MDVNVEENLESLEGVVDAAMQFVVAYGFQILGALLVLVIGIKVANWAARRTVQFGDKRDFDPTLTRFGGNVVRVMLLVLVIIITLGNFGITIAPFIAMAGAVAFGGTLAIQGPLSNYGAGLVLVLTRPFKVGSTVQIRGVHGVVEEINLAHTVLTGEDRERITIPNKEIVGQILVDSHQSRVVESRIVIANSEDADRASEIVRQAITDFIGAEQDNDAPPAQVGIHDFAYGGIVLGARFWVPSLRYFELRYAANRAIHNALRSAGVALVEPAAAAVAVDEERTQPAPGFNDNA